MARSLAELHGAEPVPEAPAESAPVISPSAAGDLGARVAALEDILAALAPRPAPDWVSGGHLASPRGAHPVTAFGTEVLRREAAATAAGQRDVRLLDVLGEELRETQQDLRDAKAQVDAPVTIGEAICRPDSALGAGGVAGLALQLLPGEALSERGKLARALAVATAVSVGAYHYGKARVVAERRAKVDQLNRRLCDLRRERASYG